MRHAKKINGGNSIKLKSGIRKTSKAMGRRRMLHNYKATKVI